MTIKDEYVEFASEGALLRGQLLLPATKGPYPCVVMSHGFSATYPMTLLSYGKRFRDAGFAALCYDHRNFGVSDGEPRWEINGWVQARGYIDALNYVKSRSDIQANNVALWGDSYSALEALIVAAVVPEISGVVAQVPACGMEPITFTPTAEMFHKLRETLLKGDVTSAIERQVGPLPVVTFTQQMIPSILPPLTAYRWFIEYGSRLGSGWNNQATWIEPKTPVPFSAHIAAPYLTSPTLTLIAPDDEMPGANPIVAQEVFKLIKGPKQNVPLTGGHFGLLYEPGDIFEYAVTSQISFLRDILKK